MPQATMIRDATPEDVEVIVDFNRRLAAESEDKQLDTSTLRSGVTALLADPDKGRYFLACDAGRPVGQMLITYEFSDWRNGMLWWIQSVYVETDWRRRGIYRALHTHVEGLAAQHGVVGLRLYVANGNQRAHQVYRQLGMVDAGYHVLEKMFHRR